MRLTLPPGLARAVAVIRPHPHRGDLIAAGAVPLAAGLAMVDVRMDGQWSPGVLFAVTVLGAALLYAMGMLAPLEGPRPRAYQTVLLLAGLVLLVVALRRFAQLLGTDGLPSGTVSWIAAVVSAAAIWPARARRSPICTLLAAVAGGVALLAFVDWVFDPGGVNVFRWVLLLLVAGFALGSLYLRDAWPRHAVHLVNAAGLATVGLGLTLYVGATLAGLTVPGLPRGASPPFWWELVLLAAAFGLIAYSGVDREPGPGYLGFVALLLFVLAAGLPDGEGALLGWPLFLLLLGAVGVAAGLRPRRPLPPEPGVGAASPPARPVPLPARSHEPAADGAETGGHDAV